MHLEITQSTGQTETLQNNFGVSVVNALYQLAVNGLDETSTVSGRISLYAASKEKVEYLAGTNGVGGNGVFPNLYIICSTYYVDFLDNAFGQVCADLYGDGYGVTQAQLLSVSNLDSLKAVSDSSVTKLDLRKFPSFAYAEAVWGFSNVTEIYINSCGSLTQQMSQVEVTSFRNMGTVVEDKRYIDKLIINNVYFSGNGRFLRGQSVAERNDTNFGTIAIRNIQLSNSDNYATLGAYTTRNGRTITNLYLGGDRVVKYSGGYGDSMFRIQNIYVPTGMASLYAADSSWTENGTTHTFYEYDFVNDPDGIFSMFD